MFPKKLGTLRVRVGRDLVRTCEVPPVEEHVAELALAHFLGVIPIAPRPVLLEEFGRAPDEARGDVVRRRRAWARTLGVHNGSD